MSEETVFGFLGNEVEYNTWYNFSGYKYFDKMNKKIIRNKKINMTSFEKVNKEFFDQYVSINFGCLEDE